MLLLGLPFDLHILLFLSVFGFVLVHSYCGFLNGNLHTISDFNNENFFLNIRDLAVQTANRDDFVTLGQFASIMTGSSFSCKVKLY